jgi:hypothetical protein
MKLNKLIKISPQKGDDLTKALDGFPSQQSGILIKGIASLT